MKRRLLAALSCIALAAACFGSPTAGNIAVSGVWTLRTVNGSAVPFSLGATQLGTREIVSASLKIDASGTFTSSLTTRETIGTTSTNTTTDSFGTWGRYKSGVFLEDSADGSTTTALCVRSLNSVTIFL